MAMLADLDAIAFVPSADLNRARVFYEGVLGLTVESIDGFAMVVGHGSNCIRIVAAGEFTPQRFTILGWETPAIEVTVQALGARGVTFLRFDGMGQDAIGIWTAPGGDQVAWFNDPDGNVLSLSHHARG